MESELISFFKQFIDDAQKDINDPGDFAGKVILSIGILIGWWAIRSGLLKIWLGLIKDAKHANRFALVTRYVLGAIVLLLMVRVWLSVDESFLVILLIVVAFALLAFKELFVNVVGWFVIIHQRPFSVYDRIAFRDVKGQVLRISWQYVTLMELAHWFDSESPTGRTIRIPNHELLEHSVKNYSDMTHYVWKEIKYTLTYASDWQAAVAIMEQVAGDYTQKELQALRDAGDYDEVLQQLELFGGKPLPTLIVDADDDGILVKVRYMVRYEVSTATKTKLQKAILEQFAKQGQIEAVGNTLYLAPKASTWPVSTAEGGPSDERA